MWLPASLVKEAWLCCQYHVKGKGARDPLARSRDDGGRWAPASCNDRNKDGMDYEKQLHTTIRVKIPVLFFVLENVSGVG